MSHHRVDLGEIIFFRSFLDWRLARDLVHTRSIDLTEMSSNDEIRPLSDEMLDRFCEHILPGIHQNIECLIVESSSIHRLFQSINYPKLFKLVLPELNLESVSNPI